MCGGGELAQRRTHSLCRAPTGRRAAVVSRPALFSPDETICSGDRFLHVVAEAGRESAVAALVTEQARKHAPPTDT